MRAPATGGEGTTGALTLTDIKPPTKRHHRDSDRPMCLIILFTNAGRGRGPPRPPPPAALAPKRAGEVTSHEQHLTDVRRRAGAGPLDIDGWVPPVITGGAAGALEGAEVGGGGAGGDGRDGAGWGDEGGRGGEGAKEDGSAVGWAGDEGELKKEDGGAVGVTGAGGRKEGAVVGLKKDEGGGVGVDGDGDEADDSGGGGGMGLVGYGSDSEGSGGDGSGSEGGNNAVRYF